MTRVGWTSDMRRLLLQLRSKHTTTRTRWGNVQSEMNKHFNTDVFTIAMVRNCYIRLTVDEHGRAKKQQIGARPTKRINKCRLCGAERRGHICVGDAMALLSMRNP